MTVDDHLKAIADAQPHPLIFATISGAHLYGFPSPDSDYDLRGVHVLPVQAVIGLDEPDETIAVSETQGDLQLDLVSHDVRKFFQLMLKRNGYVLEQLYSPLIVLTTPYHDELKTIARDCITRHHAHHYFGFARTQWDLFSKETPRRVKPLLYVYRVLLTGIHLMQTGVVEANLVRLNEHFQLPYIDELIERKLTGAEHSVLDVADGAFHRQEYERLIGLLEAAQENTHLLDSPGGKNALSDLLIRIRLAEW
jgi:hypothetical protein